MNKEEGRNKGGRKDGRPGGRKEATNIKSNNPHLAGGESSNRPLRNSCGRRLPRAWRRNRAPSHSRSRSREATLWRRLKRLRPRSLSREAQREVEDAGSGSPAWQTIGKPWENHGKMVVFNGI